MAFQALKEAKIPASRCRLTPPGSPSRKLGTQAQSRGMSKSRILAALDAEFDVFGNIKQSSAATSKTRGRPSKKPPSSRTYSTLVQPHPLTMPAGMCKSNVILSTMPEQGKSEEVVIDVDQEEDFMEDAPPEERGEESTPIDNKIYPIYSYKDYGCKPAVVYTRSEDEANDLVQCLHQPLGFDLEWRVLYRRRPGPEGTTIKLERPVAVLQLCDTKMIVVMQLSAMGKVPNKVKEILEDDSKWKCGVNIRNDAVKLYRDFGVVGRRLAELGAMARQADRTFSETYKRNIVSLQKMVAMYMHKQLAKPPVRTGNWETSPLTKEQIIYAANDAHASLMVFRRLRRIAVEQKTQNLVKEQRAYTIDLWLEMKEKSDKHKAKDITSPSTTKPEEVAATAFTELQQSEAAVTIDEACIEWQKHTRRRAYDLWQEGKLSLTEIGFTFNRGNAQVIQYILRALEAEPSLPYDFNELTTLVSKNPKARDFFREWCKRMGKDTS
ncbi:hypothetical protein NM688_g4960 [Phlebia brevispora]|uniref:Uncharacterized protein n=1 Tax=Phlebia brevispora TaxID=194682 RepID=A0ACC1T1L7_9APHY|nr:hypothetical protein NM688_g4960 [Phlebia brevispora]